MMFFGLVKVYTTKFSQRLFLLKIKKNLISIEKMCYNEFQKALSEQLLFEFSLFRFYFVSAFQYLDNFYYEYPVKQTALLYLKLPI